MVLPDGAQKTDQGRPRRTTPTFVVVVAVLAFGVLAFGLLTGTDEPSTSPVAGPTAPNPTTSTTGTTEPPSVGPDDLSVADIAQGEGLTWEHFMSIDDGYPLTMLEHGGSTYLFATDASDVSTAGEGGLRAWRSENGTNWEALGQVIDQGHVITAVDTSGRDLLAAEKGGPGEGLTVWRSHDGRLWEPETIEVDGLTGNMVVYPTAIGGNDETVLVATRTDVDVRSLVRERLAEALDEKTLPDNRWGVYDLSSEQLRFVVWGPLGFPLLEVDGDALGLTDGEKAMVEELYTSAPNSDVWISANGGEWVRAEAPTPWMESILARPDGELMATGFDSGGPGLWASDDGLNWDRSPRGIIGVVNWNDVLVGTSGTLSTLVMSEDGENWERADGIEGWPGGLRWGVSDLAAGPGGLVASVYHVPNAEVHIEALDVGPVTLRDGEISLTLDFSNGVYTLEADEFTHTWSMSLTRPPEISVVLPDGLIAFHQPDTGELLATFGFVELYEAQDDFWSSRVTDLTDDRVFVFSKDGQDWVFQDVADSMGDLEIRFLEVTGTHVVATAVSPSDPFAFGGPSPGFEIWSAPIR